MEQENGLLGAVAAAGGAVGRAVGEMFAAEKRLGDTIAAAPGSGQKFQVSKDTVLQAGKIISDQAESLAKSLRRSERNLQVDLPAGSDPVNQSIAEAWNSRLVGGEDTYAGRVKQYVDSLDELVVQLRAVATQYGFTEDEVTSAFGAAGAQ
ncbi:hypothetical protein AB0G02_12655 [Actinosynnema sp. NPDC023658]|uniref:hypothetical protein n=1 Tax=Actinosynnema sp. NPDC023658 TaxID=3155465 RepID=UPI0033C9BB35